MKKIFSCIIQIVLGTLVILAVIYLTLPKGLLFLWGLNKLGIKAVAQEIEEGFLGAELKEVILEIKGETLKFSKMYLTLGNVVFSCGNGQIKVKYSPFSKIEFDVSNIRGRCIGENRFKEIDGKFFYQFNRGFTGSLQMKEVNYVIKAPKVLIRLKGDEVEIYVPNLGIRRRFKIEKIL